MYVLVTSVLQFPFSKLKVSEEGIFFPNLSKLCLHLMGTSYFMSSFVD